jgi:aminoglycoside phosphotransferase family enzyme/predicted kinase
LVSAGFSGEVEKANMPSDNPHLVADQSEVIAFLSQPDTYGVGERPVRIDTHVAVIFLAGDEAYKMKRAVRYSFLDFSTLEKRRAVCEAEIALNRPNAPEIYIDTLPVVRRAGGLALGGEGPIVEWLVRMRRFDPADTLDHVAERGELSDPVLTDLVLAISRMHENAARGDGDAATERLKQWMDDNFAELAESPEAIPPVDVDNVQRASEAEFERRRDLLLARGRDGFVRRCHGDLHLRNIVLVDGRPILFDALEFDDAFATHDVFYDLAFLLMDLWQRGMHAEANRVRNRYLWLNAAAENIDGCVLFPLFMSVRAAIRAKVALSTAKLDEPGKARDDVTEGQRYFAWARDFLTAAPPVLVAIGGLSGSGKTTVSAALAPDLGRPPGALHLRSDIERKRLFEVADTDRLPASAYSAAVTEQVYARLQDKAGRALRAGESVIVDAVHARAEERAAIAAVARANNAPFFGLWLDAPQSILLQRVSKRSGDASDADADVVKRQLCHETGIIDWPRVDTAVPGHVERCRKLLGEIA